jgi:hypothetical protein
MPDIRTITTQAVHDALALRGLEHGGDGIMRTAAPEHYMAGERLRLAREVLRHLPAGTTASATSIKELVQKLLPVVSSAMKPGDGEGPLTFYS